MERFTCEACVKFIRERGQTHALDPIYFWGAGIFEYKTQVTPMGTKAFLNDAAFGNLIRSIPYSVKTEWKHFTGLNFPFNYVKGKKKNKPQ